MSNQSFKMEEIVIAALLHDLGKPLQRADWAHYRTKQEQVLCPFNQKGGYYFNLHVLFGDGFLNQHSGVLPEALNRNQIINPSVKHHQPDTPADWLVAMADRYSSGSDRMHDTEGQSDKTYYEQPLLSVFNNIVVDGETAGQRLAYPLKPLEPPHTFPQANISLTRQDYANLCADFESDFLKLQGLTPEKFIAALDSLLEHYFWCVPSTTVQKPDISLYDHSRTTAALVAALYRFHEADNTLQDVKTIQDRETEKFLFVSGDLSGIQHYLFDLKSTKANAKMLRARSFELQALLEFAAFHILRGVGLPPQNRIMDAGGRFLLLLPNTKAARDIVSQTRQMMDTHCAERYFGELSVNISSGITASGKMLEQDKAVMLFQRIAEDVAEAKQRKLQVYLRNNSPVLGHEYERIEGNENVCPLCEVRAINSSGEYCGVCERLIKFGQSIPKRKYLAWDYMRGKEGLLFPDGARLVPFDKESQAAQLFPYTINFYQCGYPTRHLPFYVPRNDDGSVWEFEKIAGESKGVKYLGMLKADVDNLGFLFSHGLQKNMSISRYATLSRMMDYFFSGYLNYFLQNNYPNVYTVYAGGDDLCLIGPWNEMIHLSKDLNEKFRNYTGNHPGITLSAGIAVANNRLPVKQMADVAEAHLEQSKGKGKNRLTVFQTTVPWNNLNGIFGFMQYLDSIYGSGKGISSGLLYRLLEYSRRHQQFKSGTSVCAYNALWRSHMMYDLARNVSNERTRQQLVQEVLKQIDHMNLIASYVIYKNRK
ncbi:MAG: type III-A CRISPR-associated protein Cas10/Csm1 [Calditrichia bacterium]